MSEALGKLLTDLGERSSYDAASQCSRCGYCEQACPTYVATGREAFSPRGRNQLVRLLLEGKLQPDASTDEALSSCLLCGACQSACYAHVSTPDIVLEGRRLSRERAPWLARALGALLLRRPALFRWLLRLAYLGKRLGLSRLARPVLRLAGLGGLADADAHVAEAPLAFLVDELRRRPRPEDPAWLYFAACGPNFVLPRVGRATWKALEALRGPGAWLKAGCCGLLAYNYGELEDAREAARRVIAAAEAAGTAPVVADCSSCAAFLKGYPQLFLEDAAWASRARAFAARVRDAVELLDAELPRRAAGPAAYHQSCRACHGQGLRPPEKLMRTACEPRELAESDACCGGAGAFAFVHPELSDQVLRRKIGKIAESRAELVVASSTSCLLQLAHGLRKYYPQAQVVHASELAALALVSQPDGTQTGT